MDADLRRLVLTPAAGTDERTDLDDTAVAQPALFAVEYALVRLWESWGVRPHAFVGHSLGEYVAACLAGVFTLEDAAVLVARRGRLMREAEPGAMLGVELAERDLRALPDGLCLAAVNAAGLCTVAGPEPAIADFGRRLAERGVAARRLRTTRAFHSPSMAAAARELRALVAKMETRPPELPYVSNVTGDWIGPEQTADPGYWAEHTLRPVRFADGLSALLRAAPDALLLEVGPGHTLSAAARRQVPAGTAVVPSLAHPRSALSAGEALERAAGGVWAAGVPVDWRRRTAHERRRRVPLPSYPFERTRHWRADLAGAPTAWTTTAWTTAAEPATGTTADAAAHTAAGTATGTAADAIGTLTARSTGEPPGRPARTARSCGRSPRSGRSCSACPPSPRTTTSSSSAGTRCWARGWRAGCATGSGWSCGCASCSPSRP